MTAKMIYLARRNPALAREAFPRRWRQHAKLAGTLPDVVGVATSVHYCTVVPGRELYANNRDEYDGVGLVGVADERQLAEMHRQTVSNPVTREDELKVFSTYVEKFALFARERVLTDRGPGKAVLIEFVPRRPGVSPADFERIYTTEFAPRTGALLRGAPLLKLLRRYVQNIVVPPGPPPGYEFDAVAELWFDSLEDLRTAMAPCAQLDALVAAAGEFIDMSRIVQVATEVTHAWKAP
ncbi:MAG: EthD domain-containing protein [Gammaproteobacteria bacterium]